MSVVLTLIDVEVSLASLDLEISHVPSCFDLVSPPFCPAVPAESRAPPHEQIGRSVSVCVCFSTKLVGVLMD